MRIKKIGVLALALVLALGTLGVGFAHWSGTLDISGTVHTGTFGAELTQNNGVFSNAIDDEMIGAEAINSSWPFGFPSWRDTSKTQDTGHATCVLSNLKADYSGTANDTMVINVTNAYPCYNVWVPVDVHCVGTIPIKVWYNITNANPADVITIEMIADPALGAGELSLVGANSEANATKLHQCNTTRALIHIHPLQPNSTATPVVPGAAPNTTYTFSITVNYVQAQ